MSISKVFYTLIEDKSVVFQSAEFQSDYTIFRGRLRQNCKKCPNCKASNVRIKETKERTFRMLNLGQKRTYLKMDSHKVWCRQCNAITWLQPSFSSGKLPMTKSFINYVLQLTAMTTLLCVALFLGLQWKTVKSLDKASLSKRAKQFSFRKLRYISIDEIAIRKGHKYMTIFTDIATGQIIHAVEGRDEESLRPFLKLLSKKARRLKGIGIDMSAAYSSSIQKHLSHVAIIYDRFHVTKLLNDTVDKVRRAEYVKHKDAGLAVMKGQRFLLLRNFVDLDNEQKSSLESLLEVNQSLSIAHSMKEQFRLFWGLASKREGAKFLGWWIIQAMESGVAQLERTARTLLHHYLGLLSYFDHGIDNGKAEGINNKIKVLKRQAYGFRDQEYFKLRLYNLHRRNFELVG
jgi:transposase